MAPDVKGRVYDTTGRRARSAEKRRQILDAARELFIERGYRKSTVAAIATRAEVNVDTVYELVGRKPVLLRELIEEAISGADRAVVADEREYVREVLAQADPGRKLEIYAAAIREIHGRMAPLFLALRDASSTEPEAHEVWREISDRRANNMRMFVTNVRDAGGWRPGLSIEEAADVVWATNSAELYVMLTMERGWAPVDYERWLAETWKRLLLA